ncbi:MAG: hypothetical protein AAFR17_18030, partial [Pseudomonadota bacterium]
SPVVSVNTGAAPDEMLLRRSTAPSDRLELFVFGAKDGTQARLVAVLGYDAVRVAGAVFAQAKAGGGTDPFPTAALTRPTGFQGGIGAIRFTPDGLSQRALAVLEVQNRRFRTVDPAPAAFGAGS